MNGCISSCPRGWERGGPASPRGLRRSCARSASSRVLRASAWPAAKPLSQSLLPAAKSSAPGPPACFPTLSLVSVAPLSRVTPLCPVHRMKPTHTVVNCWFCSQDTVVPYGNRNCWDCPHCEQYNGFQEVTAKRGGGARAACPLSGH